MLSLCTRVCVCVCVCACVWKRMIEEVLCYRLWLCYFKQTYFHTTYYLFNSAWADLYSPLAITVYLHTLLLAFSPSMTLVPEQDAALSVVVPFLPSPFSWPEVQPTTQGHVVSCGQMQLIILYFTHHAVMYILTIQHSHHQWMYPCHSLIVYIQTNKTCMRTACTRIGKHNLVHCSLFMTSIYSNHTWKMQWLITTSHPTKCTHVTEGTFTVATQCALTLMERFHT